MGILMPLLSSLVGGLQETFYYASLLGRIFLHRPIKKGKAKIGLQINQNTVSQFHTRHDSNSVVLQTSVL